MGPKFWCKNSKQPINHQGGSNKPPIRPLSLTEDPRLLKAFEGSKGFLRPQEGPRRPGRFQEPREAQGGSGGEREQEGVREVRGSKGSKAAESDWRPKAAKGSPGLLMPQEGSRCPGRLRGKGEWEGVRVARGWGGAREARPLSLTKDPSLPKASKGSQGFLRPQEGPRGPERPRGQGEQEGVRGSGGEREARPLSLTEDPRLPKASKDSQGFLRPQEVLRGPRRLRGQGEWG